MELIHIFDQRAYGSGKLWTMHVLPLPRIGFCIECGTQQRKQICKSTFQFLKRAM